MKSVVANLNNVTPAKPFDGRQAHFVRRSLQVVGVCRSVAKKRSVGSCQHCKYLVVSRLRLRHSIFHLARYEDQLPHLPVPGRAAVRQTSNQTMYKGGICT